ncbi:MAG: mechanosensitive ion channel protein MscS [Cycloclasticus sp.]|nr:mechanosensitive ion channel protein MscS [Cycloclasticus sp.]MBG97137.1 mechanosensitive ion channel protein MscS [Cycloclasticus sp.]HAI97562.1 mechanosensitive ion channel protein MscS [Methylococcaceae bacterium]
MNKVWASLLRPKAWISAGLLITFLMSFFSLGFLDYLQPMKTFLDSDDLSFKIGTTRFSVYLLIKATVIVVLVFWITGILSEFGENRIKKIRGIKASNKALIVKAFQILIYFIAFIIGLDVLGIDLTTLAIFSGAIGIGIGFGLQKITSNFISGLILLFEKSVENDDLVELTDGTYGYIRHTSARYTLIETFEGKEIMIPNEDFITNRVTNWTYTNSKGRVAINIGVSYESDIEKAMELILEAAKEHPRCVDEPSPSCYLEEFADSSVNFILFFWLADVTEGRFEPRSDVLRSIWKKFKENNIVIPYPQRDLHIKNPEALQ